MNFKAKLLCFQSYMKCSVIPSQFGFISVVQSPN